MSTTAHFSVTEYDRIVNTGALDGRRLELIHGEIREMSPIGPIHEDIVDRLTEWSFATVRDARIRIQHSVGLSGLDSAPEPDVAWVTKGDYRKARPSAKDVLLIIEVADSSVAYDLGEKAAVYATERVSEYWVVDIPSQELVVRREPQGDQYQSVQRLGLDGVAAPLARPDVCLEVGGLFPTDD